jgi:hypothetical protein
MSIVDGVFRIEGLDLVSRELLFLVRKVSVRTMNNFYNYTHQVVYISSEASAVVSAWLVFASVSKFAAQTIEYQ